MGSLTHSLVPPPALRSAPDRRYSNVEAAATIARAASCMAPSRAVPMSAVEAREARATATVGRRRGTEEDADGVHVMLEALLRPETGTGRANQGQIESQPGHCAVRQRYCRSEWTWNGACFIPSFYRGWARQLQSGYDGDKVHVKRSASLGNDNRMPRINSHCGTKGAGL